MADGDAAGRTLCGCLLGALVLAGLLGWWGFSGMAADQAAADSLLALDSGPTPLPKEGEASAPPRALDDEGPVKEIHLMAAYGEEHVLDDALAVLARRLDLAAVRHEIARDGLRFTVRVPDEKEVLDQVYPLLLATGRLEFKIVAQRDVDVVGELYDETLAAVQEAKRRGSYDPETSPYDVLDLDGVSYLLENPGFPGFYIVEAWATFENDKWYVKYRLSPAGDEAYNAFVNAAAGRQEATIMDGAIDALAHWSEGPFELETGATWYWPSPDEDPWSKADAHRNALLLTSGALPIELTLEKE